MLIHADADVARLDLDQFGQRILKASTDRNGAAQIRIHAGQLFLRLGGDAEVGGQLEGGRGGLETLAAEAMKEQTGGTVNDDIRQHARLSCIWAAERR